MQKNGAAAFKPPLDGLLVDVEPRCARETPCASTGGISYQHGTHGCDKKATPAIDVLESRLTFAGSAAG